MPGPKRKKILVQPRRRPQREFAKDCNYSVTSTLLNIPDIGAVIVPWLVLKSDPSGVTKVFQKQQGEVIADDWVNVFMSLPNLRESIFGSLDEFSQTWIIKVESSRDLSDIIYRLTSYPTVVSAYLRSNSLMQQSVDIPVVVIIQPKAKCIESLIEKLNSVEHQNNSVEKFYFEVDLAPSVKRWATIVLKEDLTVRGGRFAIGSGAPYNHMFDWQNVFCCVPCLPCCLVASPLYRLQRRLRYKQCLGGREEPMVIVGAETTHPEDQAMAIRKLMAWAKYGEPPIGCKRCGMLRRGPRKNGCACDKNVVPDPPVIVQLAPVDTKETIEMQESRKANEKDLQDVSSNPMLTLRDIKQFNQASLIEREKAFYNDDDATSRDSVHEVIDETETIISKTSGSSLKSSGTFSFGDLRIFSIAANSKIHPIDENDDNATTPRQLKDRHSLLF